MFDLSRSFYFDLDSLASSAKPEEDMEVEEGCGLLFRWTPPWKLLPILNDCNLIDEVPLPLLILRMATSGLITFSGWNIDPFLHSTRRRDGFKSFATLQSIPESPSFPSRLSNPESQLSPLLSPFNWSPPSSCSSTGTDYPRTPSDISFSESPWIASNESPPSMKLNRKRRCTPLLSIRVPEARPLPDVEIERDQILVLDSLQGRRCHNQIKQSLFLQRETTSDVPEFVTLEHHGTPSAPESVGQTHGLESLTPVPCGPVSLRAHFERSLSVEETNNQFLALSTFLSVRNVLDIAPRIVALDISLPDGYVASWDLDHHVEPLSHLFFNLLSFKWNGTLISNCLPAPFYDLNSLPLNQMREIVLANCTLSTSDLKRLLLASPVLEELVVESIIADLDHYNSHGNGAASARLECPLLRFVHLSTFTDLDEIICQLDSPSLKEVVYEPKGYGVLPVTLYNFPWNIMRASLDTLTIVSREDVDGRVLEELERFSEEDAVRVEVSGPRVECETA